MPGIKQPSTAPTDTRQTANGVSILDKIQVDQPRILFLSDCYLEKVCWGTFYLSIMRNLAAISSNLLAIRTNSFLQNASITPLSTAHLNTMLKAIKAFKPDIVFSLNHSGIFDETLKVIPEQAKIITLFIDFYGRCPEELRNFNNRDFVWSTGLGSIRDNFISDYRNVLSQEQMFFSLWGSDTSVFYPQSLYRDINICFVGSAFDTNGFAALINALSNDPSNLQIFIDVYQTHRKSYIFNLVKELTYRNFDFNKVTEHYLRTVTTNSRLQNLFADQISAEERMRYLSALHDLNIQIYGEPIKRWLDLICASDGRLLSNFQFNALYDDLELAKVYNRSKIGLNIQIDHARDCGLSFRAFDIMACRTLLLTPDLSKKPLESLGFKAGQDFITYANIQDLKEKCQYYLENNSEREHITQSAFLKVQEGNTFRHRLSKVFEKAGLSNLAANIMNIPNSEINNELYQSKIFFLDHYGKERGFGQDFELSDSTSNTIYPDRLNIQFNTSVLQTSIPFYSLPLWLKSILKQIAKPIMQTITKLTENSKKPIIIQKTNTNNQNNI